VVVDDSSPSGYTQTGDWTTDSGLGVNNELVYHPGGDATASTATWAAGGLAAGSYAVQADWNGYSGHSPSAQYTVLVNGTAVGSYSEDQTAASAGGPAAGNLVFQTIATVSVPAGATIALMLSSGGGGDVVADAARFAPTPTPTAVVVATNPPPVPTPTPPGTSGGSAIVLRGNDGTTQNTLTTGRPIDSNARTPLPFARRTCSG